MGVWPRGEGCGLQGGGLRWARRLWCDGVRLCSSSMKGYNKVTTRYQPAGGASSRLSSSSLCRVGDGIVATSATNGVHHWLCVAMRDGEERRLVRVVCVCVGRLGLGGVRSHDLANRCHGWVWKVGSSRRPAVPRHGPGCCHGHGVGGDRVVDKSCVCGGAGAGAVRVC